MIVRANQAKGGRKWLAQCPKCSAVRPLRANFFDRDDHGSYDCLSCGSGLEVVQGFHSELSRHGSWLVTTFGLEHDGIHYAVEKKRLTEIDWFSHISQKAWCDKPDDLAEALNFAGVAFRLKGALITPAEVDRVITDKAKSARELAEFEEHIQAKREYFANRTELAMPKKKVTVFHDDGRFGIATTAETQEEFLREFSGCLSDLVGESVLAGMKWQDVFALLLAQAFEITAKLKGYKADVTEERVIYAGAAFVDEKASIASR